ncbi:MAG: hypothetical protein DI630_13315 [Gordonia sp. (in: high G+C Gram-positive bacteria)]|nr:MAG: hypothetical protein DI630_13315 [Gordonia sp. (in: high G+C Gram-positive bacteria)]
MLRKPPARDPQRTATRLVEALPFRRPWDIDEFTASIGLITGKPITVSPLPTSLEDEISGLWVPSPTINRIYITTRGDATYQEHVRCHELAHVVLAHEGTDELDAETYRAQLRRIAPDLPEAFLSQLGPARVCFARASYISELEQIAEWMATLIQARADTVRGHVYLDGHDRSSYAIAERFLGALGWKS